MPVQAPQWTDYLSCPVCENGFEVKIRLPVSLGCGHTVCKTCLSNLQRRQCPFDQTAITIPLDRLPVNTALTLLLGSEDSDEESSSNEAAVVFGHDYEAAMRRMETLAVLLLRPSSSANRQQLSRPMQRKLVTLINCQPLEEEGRTRAVRAARSLGERSVTELILQHQNPQQLSANLWAAVRTRGCQFLGPAMQEEVLKLVLLALEDGSPLSRKVLVMFVVQRLEPQFPQASKTSIGHVVQLLYRASCFKVTKRDGDSSLMQLKEEFRTYETLRREHDAQIVQIANESGLRIAPDQWSSLLYGDAAHKSHMQSIVDKLQTPQSFVQSVQELLIALQRTGDPGKLTALRSHLDLLSGLDPSPDNAICDWDLLDKALAASERVVVGLLTYMTHHRRTAGSNGKNASVAGGDVVVAATAAVVQSSSRYKTSLCRDLSLHGSCPRGQNCTFAHSTSELEEYRNKNNWKADPAATGRTRQPWSQKPAGEELQDRHPARVPPLMPPATPCVAPVAQVAPVPRRYDRPPPAARQQQMVPLVRYQNHHPLAVFPPPQQQPRTRTVLLPPHHHHLPPPPPPPSQQFQLQGYHQHPGHAHILQTAVMQPEATQQQLYYHTLEDVRVPDVFSDDDSKSIDDIKVATKSLSALKSRKEEIIDSLQRIVGEEETKKISVLTAERAVATTLQNNAALASIQEPPSAAAAAAGDENYCLWTSRVFTPLVVKGGENQKEVVAPKLAPSPVVVAETVTRPPPPLEDAVPFSESPQISRFGPISRRGGVGPNSALQFFTTAQTQAAIDDEPQSTPVVTNSKQMSRPAPPIPAAFLHQNGTFTQLQPVAVGVNGEIGFVAVQQQQQQSENQQQMAPNVAVPIEQLRHLHNVASHRSSLGTHHHRDAQLHAESERMKHEVEVLQQKIECLNLARMNDASINASANEDDDAVETDDKSEREPPAAASQDSREKAQLTNELQLIENTIHDRELEISINRRQGCDGFNTFTSTDSGAAAAHVNCGMVIDSGGGAGGDRGASLGITTIARSGQVPRTKGRFFEPF